MRYRIHQDSYINGVVVFGYSRPDDGIPRAVAEPGMVSQEEYNRRIASEIEVPPLVKVGDFWSKTLAGGQRMTLKADVPVHHVPGPHWEPLDDEAKAWATKCGHVFTGEVPDVLDGLTEKLASMQATLSADSSGTIASAIVEALIKAGLARPAEPSVSARHEASRETTPHDDEAEYRAWLREKEKRAATGQRLKAARALKKAGGSLPDRAA